MITFDAAYMIASNLPNRSLALFTGICRRFRPILYNAAIWKPRLEGRPVPFEAFEHLASRGATATIQSLQITPSLDYHANPTAIRCDVTAPQVESLTFHDHVVLDEVQYVLCAVRTENLKHLSLSLPQNWSAEFFRAFSNFRFPNLRSLEYHAWSFTRHASLFAALCPNLESLKILEILTYNNTEAAVFENLRSLSYAGQGIGAAKHFERSLALRSLDVRDCGTTHHRWLRLQCEELEELCVPRFADDATVLDMLTKWHRTLRKVSVPARFVTRELVPFVERFQGSLRLESVRYYWSLFERVDWRLEDRLYETCPSLRYFGE